MCDRSLVMNLAGGPDSHANMVEDALDVFAEQVIVLPVREDGNHILIAFTNARFEPRRRAVHQQAKALRRTYGLDFPAFAEKIERAGRFAPPWSCGTTTSASRSALDSIDLSGLSA